ncbi:MAG: hypothetical protein ABWY54_08095, partial [Glaciihabitans sp.]
VSLLPPAMVDEARQRRVTRRFVLAVAGVLLLAGVGVLGATLRANDARAQLAAAQADTALLTAEQGRYTEAETLSGLLATLADARSYGTSTEIDWTSYVDQLIATMPAGTTLTEVSVSAAAPWETQLAPTGPLRGEVVGTLHLRVRSAAGADLTSWVRGLEALPGYADSSLDDRTAETGDGKPATYTASITLNVGAGARSGRFAPEPAATATPAITTESE